MLNQRKHIDMDHNQVIAIVTPLIMNHCEKFVINY